MSLDKIKESRSDEELGAEVSILKDQMDAMQRTLREMQQGSSNNSKQSSTSTTNGNSDRTAKELMRQIQDFRNQAVKQQQQSQQQLQHSLNQAIEALTKMQEQIQSNQILGQMNSLIEQVQQQLNQMTPGGQSSQDSQNHDYNVIHSGPSEM